MVGRVVDAGRARRAVEGGDDDQVAGQGDRDGDGGSENEK